MPDLGGRVLVPLHDEDDRPVLARVVTYLDDPRDFGRYNAVFKKYFDGAVLARTTVESRAAIKVRIEMDAIVYKPLDN